MDGAGLDGGWGASGRHRGPGGGATHPAPSGRPRHKQLGTEVLEPLVRCFDGSQGRRSQHPGRCPDGERVGQLDGHAGAPVMGAMNMLDIEAPVVRFADSVQWIIIFIRQNYKRQRAIDLVTCVTGRRRQRAASRFTLRSHPPIAGTRSLRWSRRQRAPPVCLPPSRRALPAGAGRRSVRPQRACPGCGSHAVLSPGRPRPSQTAPSRDPLRCSPPPRSHH